MSTDNLNHVSIEDRRIIRHWSEYGQRGATPLRRILSSDWPNIAPFVHPRSAQWCVPIAAHQLPLLLKGFMPSESDSASIQQMLAQGLVSEGEVLRTHAYMSASRENYDHISEDKWFICSEGPDADGRIVLHMYRSWTGQEIVQLSIQTTRFHGGDSHETTDLAEITSIAWEVNANMDEEEDRELAKSTALEVCEWVLNVDLEECENKQRPSPEQLSAELDRAMSRLPTVDSQTLHRNGQNPQRGTRAFNQN
jgi:hypothetical protein